MSRESQKVFWQLFLHNFSKQYEILSTNTLCIGLSGKPESFVRSWIFHWNSESVMGPSDKWATRGSMCDFERRGLPSLSKSQIGPSVAHSFLKPITDSISSMAPLYCLKMIAMTSRSYEWIPFVTSIMEENMYIEHQTFWWYVTRVAVTMPHDFQILLE